MEGEFMICPKERLAIWKNGYGTSRGIFLEEKLPGGFNMRLWEAACSLALPQSLFLSFNLSPFPTFLSYKGWRIVT
jgi:hypothetical protein